MTKTSNNTYVINEDGIKIEMDENLKFVRFSVLGVEDAAVVEKLNKLFATVKQQLIETYKAIKVS